ncbi:MAG TPA: hypothetical protein VND98_10775 [Solirubrobacterales bacterium]|nr:hypothetical protein [Solirubrobacterales bacterium]
MHRTQKAPGDSVAESAATAKEHGHTHGLVDESIKRSREGLKAVALSLLVLALAAGAQTIVFLASASVALLADLIHNFGDASTAIPLGAAFLLRSRRAEHWAGLFVVAAIFASACVAAVEAILRLIHPQSPTHLTALAVAGLIGFAGKPGGGPDPNPSRRVPCEPRPDRRRQPCAGRFLRQPGRCRDRRIRCARIANRRPLDRTGDHRCDPQDHLGPWRTVTSRHS